ncbi:MAG: glycosyl hydrolase family 28-related protein [bacterium]
MNRSIWVVVGFFVFSICLSHLAFGQAASVSADVSQTRSILVTQFGTKADSLTDDTAAIQKALDAAGKAGGGEVFLPAGKYRIEGSLTVPSGVTLRGVWEAPHHSDQSWGSALWVVAGRGQEDGPPAVELRPSSTIRGVTIFYPEQSIDDIQPYPWAIRGAGMNCSVLDVTLVAAYQGINFGYKHHELHVIRNVYGCVLRRGFFIDQCTDIGRIEDVHINPHYWARADAPNAPKEGGNWNKLADYVNNNLEVFIFARSDWEYVFNTFAWGFKICYKFVQAGHGGCNGNFLGIGADGGQYALWVEHTQTPGLLITNGEFVTFAGDSPIELVTTETFKGVVQLTNCSFWGPTRSCAELRGPGFVSFQQCNFCDWSKEDYAIRAISGDVIISDSRFGANKPHILLDGDLSSAIIKGNRFRGPLQFDNKSDAQVEMGLNIADKP